MRVSTSPFHVAYEKLMEQIRFTAYMSCLIILSSTTHMILHDYPQHVWQGELSYAKTCLDVLDFCSSADSVAQIFKDTTQEFYDILHSQVQDQGQTIAKTEAFENFSHLLANPRSGSTSLHLTSQRLLEYISRPFGDPSNLPVEKTLNTEEVILGAHLDWNSVVTSPFNRSGPGSVGGETAFSRAFSGMSSGRFIGSIEPNGWNTSQLT